MSDDQAFEAYQTYKWGVDPKVLRPIDDAIVATQGDAGARRELETKIAAVLGSEAPRAAKDYACRQLRKIGSGASVPATSRPPGRFTNVFLRTIRPGGSGPPPRRA